MRIGFTGTQSVGKSTLVNELKKLPRFKDYHFAVERSKYLRDLGIPLNTDSTLKGQTIFLAERCTELFHQDLITDRTAIDVIAFTLNASSITQPDKTLFELYAKSLITEYDHIFYISPEGIEIEDNSVRTTDSDYRDKIDNTIKYLTNTYKSYINNFHEIHGMTVEERVDFVINSIDK